MAKRLPATFAMTISVGERSVESKGSQHCRSFSPEIDIALRAFASRIPAHKTIVVIATIPPNTSSLFHVHAYISLIVSPLAARAHTTTSAGRRRLDLPRSFHHIG